jgi:hypothetical protein
MIKTFFEVYRIDIPVKIISFTAKKRAERYRKEAQKKTGIKHYIKRIMK